MMGYRSDVRALVYATNRSDADQYMQLKLLMSTTFKEVMDEWKDYIRWIDNERVFEFQAEGIKWYESYDDIRRFERFLRDVEALEYIVEFVRVGEDDGDVDTRYSNGAKYFLDTVTTITCYF